MAGNRSEKIKINLKKIINVQRKLVPLARGEREKKTLVQMLGTGSSGGDAKRKKSNSQ